MGGRMGGWVHGCMGGWSRSLPSRLRCHPAPASPTDRLEVSLLAQPWHRPTPLTRSPSPPSLTPTKVFRGPDKAVWVKKEGAFRMAVMSEMVASGLLGGDRAVKAWYKESVYPQYPTTDPDVKLKPGLH